MEQGAGDRVATKWLPKPWEKAFTGAADHPISKNEFESTKDKQKAVGIHWDKSAGGRWTPADKFPLLDYDFPKHPGRVVLRWLYKQGKEPVQLQRSELMTHDFGLPDRFL